MSAQVPEVLRSLPARRLLDMHRKHHGLAVVVGEDQDGLPVRRGRQRVASLQASGPEDAIAILQLALQGLLEVQAVERQRRTDLSGRLELLYTRIQSMEGELDDNVRKRTRALVRQNKRLASAANTDPLTGLLNRRALDAALRELEADAGREAMNVCVLMVDVDRFKAVNDTYGHLVGDTVLAAIAKLLRTRCRKGDVVGRWGGEEFMILLPCCPVPAGVRIAEELRASIAKLALEGQHSDVRVTASFGVAGAVLGADGMPVLSELVAEADRRLYVAKRSGRDRVVGDPDGVHGAVG